MKIINKDEVKELFQTFLERRRIPDEDIQSYFLDFISQIKNSILKHLILPEDMDSILLKNLDEENIFIVMTSKKEKIVEIQCENNLTVLIDNILNKEKIDFSFEWGYIPDKRSNNLSINVYKNSLNDEKIIAQYNQSLKILKNVSELLMVEDDFSPYLPLVNEHDNGIIQNSLYCLSLGDFIRLKKEDESTLEYIYDVFKREWNNINIESIVDLKYVFEQIRIIKKWCKKQSDIKVLFKVEYYFNKKPYLKMHFNVDSAIISSSDIEKLNFESMINSNIRISKKEQSSNFEDIKDMTIYDFFKNKKESELYIKLLKY